MSSVFPYVTMVLENHSECVLFEAEQRANATGHLEQSSSPSEANFYVAVCSMQPVEAESFVYVRTPAMSSKNARNTYAGYNKS